MVHPEQRHLDPTAANLPVALVLDREPRGCLRARVDVDPEPLAPSPSLTSQLSVLAS